ncbi:MAG TPA: hypothetical protein V6D29_09315 [Leptolyngbyaceae cyanobacterium]
MKFNRLLPLLAGSLTLIGMAAILPARANVDEVRPNEATTRPDTMGADRDELDMNDNPANMMQPSSNTIQRLGDDSSSGMMMYNQMYDTTPGSATYDGLFPPDSMGGDRDELDANDIRAGLMNYRDNNINPQRNVIQRQGNVNQGSMYDRGNTVRPDSNMNNMNNMNQPNYTQPDAMGGERDELDMNDNTNMNNSRPGADVIRREGDVNQGGNVFDLNNLSQPENIYQQDSMGADRDELDMNDNTNNMNNSQPTLNNRNVGPSGQTTGNND